MELSYKQFQHKHFYYNSLIFWTYNHEIYRDPPLSLLIILSFIAVWLLLYPIAEIPCMQLHCGKYSTCDTEAGKCVCTYGDVYNGPQCTDCECSSYIVHLQ